MKKLLVLAVLLFLFTALYSNTSCIGKRIKQADVDFTQIKTNIYYVGVINESRFFVIVDTVSTDYLKGRFFEYNNEIFANEIIFEIIPKRKSFVFKSETVKQELIIDFKTRGRMITGNYRLNDKFLGIINRWSDPYDVRFGIHMVPEFVTYPNRYNEVLFPKSEVIGDVVYGSASGYWDTYAVDGESYWKILERGLLNTANKRRLNLKADVYLPQEDTLKERPFIMFIHGGGFYIGDKKSKPMQTLCEYFSSLGYVTASINYRMGFKPVNYSIERAGYRALQDAHAAMRYFVNNMQKYGIDTSLLFVGGSSAGGITSLNLAFMRNKDRPKSSYGNILFDDLGNIESSTNNLKNKFSIKALINMWGALDDISILQNAQTSIISIHGTADKIVPYYYDFPFQDIKGWISKTVFNKIYGSHPIHEAARIIGLREKLVSLENLGHSPDVDEKDQEMLNDIFYLMRDEIQGFIFEEIVPDRNFITTIMPALNPEAQIAYRSRYSNIKKIHWAIEGGLILNTSNNTVRVIWFKDAPAHRLHMSALHPNGTAFYDKYEF